MKFAFYSSCHSTCCNTSGCYNQLVSSTVGTPPVTTPLSKFGKSKKLLHLLYIFLKIKKCELITFLLKYLTFKLLKFSQKLGKECNNLTNILITI